MSNITEITTGLRFPEGPIAMPDGSIILVEIERQTLSRVSPNGEVRVVAEMRGGPNGAGLARMAAATSAIMAALSGSNAMVKN